MHFTGQVDKDDVTRRNKQKVAQVDSGPKQNSVNFHIFINISSEHRVQSTQARHRVQPPDMGVISLLPMHMGFAPCADLRFRFDLIQTVKSIEWLPSGTFALCPVRLTRQPQISGWWQAFARRFTWTTANGRKNWQRVSRTRSRCELVFR